MSPQRLVLLALLLYIAWRLIRSLIRDTITQKAKDLAQKKAEQAEEATVQDMLVEDPVCHTLIPQHQAICLRHNGKNYYFCSDACCDQFTGDPGGKE
ncbi:MAG: YHS domain-containing protein [Candidatus Electrothrix sp. MAN1_4]|nr:YHS domain-containing protein [Candidatus Electrothrix sp. MAN1_4]